MGRIPTNTNLSSFHPPQDLRPKRCLRLLTYALTSDTRAFHLRHGTMRCFPMGYRIRSRFSAFRAGRRPFFLCSEAAYRTIGKSYINMFLHIQLFVKIIPVCNDIQKAPPPDTINTRPQLQVSVCRHTELLIQLLFLK